MWVVKIRLIHDCIIGNRCREFDVTLQSYDLNEDKRSEKTTTSSLHHLHGSEKNIKAFIQDLKLDKRTEYLEVNGKMLFLVESAKNKPVSQFSRRMFFVKPVVIDTNGYEHWEIASPKRKELTDFIKKVEPLCEEFDLQSIQSTKLNDIYFPKVLPQLTDLQKRAFELAIQKEYYEAPKKTNLRALAKLMGISLATYQKHLQKAEQKVMPDILSYLK